MATAAAPRSAENPEARRRRPTARTRRPRPERLVAGQRVGAWRVEGELGRGGMASVYAVSHTGFGKRAALKVAHRSALADDTVEGGRLAPETFLREARIVHLIDHPGVCDVFATGTFDGRPYLAMERLHGETLGALAKRGPLPRHEALGILIELCAILGAAHAKGVVHRDLKLENVFVTPLAGARRVRLLDWGIARVLAEPDPLKGMVAGTLTYVSPEQVTTGDVTAAADIYALGVVAYQLLLGAPPFTSTTDLELIWKHVNAAPPAPAQLRPDVPEELADVLVAMLAKVAAERPAHDEVFAAFEAARAAA
ncbi:MAG: serine/threonine protein kinase, partial [Deltaproteobacteria bacterium]|nr:serine/threonine protein kinase [Deltaproteobacteria bacterium]